MTKNFSPRLLLKNQRVIRSTLVILPAVLLCIKYKAKYSRHLLTKHRYSILGWSSCEACQWSGWKYYLCPSSCNHHHTGTTVILLSCVEVIYYTNLLRLSYSLIFSQYDGLLYKYPLVLVLINHLKTTGL